MLAPSYRTLFRNVDRTVDGDGYENTHPLHLKTITIAGLPVEEIPCVEVYDLSGKVRFCFRAALVMLTVSTLLCSMLTGAAALMLLYCYIAQVFGSHASKRHTSMCTWDAEYGDGYFQVGQDILGDFTIVCRWV